MRRLLFLLSLLFCTSVVLAEDSPSGPSPRSTKPVRLETFPLRGKASEANIAFLKKDFATASKLLSTALASQDVPYAYELSYLRARALFAQKLYEDAAGVLKKLSATEGSLSNDIAYFLAMSLEKLGKTEDAKKQFARVSPQSRFFDDARLSRARLSSSLADAKDILKARFYWTEDRVKVLLLLQTLAKKENNASEERRAVIELFCEYPHTDAGAALLSKEIWTYQPTATELHRHLTVLLQKSKKQQAQDFVSAVEKKLPANDPALPLLQADLLLQQKNWKKLSSTLTTLEKNPDYALRAARLRGNMLAKQGDTEGALAAYRDIFEKNKGVEAGLAIWDALRLLRDQNTLTDADDLATKLAEYSSILPNPREALWLSAWVAWRTGDDSAAEKRLQKILTLLEALSPAEQEEEDFESRKDGFSSRERALYWMARAKQRSGQKKEAIALYRSLVNEAPLRYYSHQAFERLLEIGDKETTAKLRVRFADKDAIALIPVPTKAETEVVAVVPQKKQKQKKPPKKDSLPRSWTVPSLDTSSLYVVPDESVRPALALYGLGLLDEAAEDLKEQANYGFLSADGSALLGAIFMQNEGMSRASWLMLWKGMLRSYPASLDVTRASEEETARARLLDLGWKLSYPRAYGELVDYYAKEFDVPTELVFAIMRAESIFRPSVVSSAKAVGLVQVLPTTAAWIAKELLGVGKPSQSALFEETINLRLGTRFMKELVYTFKGNYALAIASYNAGPGAGARWYNRWKDLETDELIEEIPFKETHGYTKKVLGSMGTYRYLWGEPSVDSGRSLNLPKFLPASLNKLGSSEKKKK